MSKLSKDLRDQLARYLSGDVEPKYFHDWFARNLLEVAASNDSEAELLFHAIEWQFFDLEKGRASSDATRTNLTYLSQEHPAPNPVNFLNVTASNGNNANYIRAGVGSNTYTLGSPLGAAA
jgi:hypothetical protein